MTDRGEYEQFELPNTEPLLTKRQAAQLLNVEERFITRCVFEKRIAYVKVGRHVRIPERAIRGFIAAHTVDPTERRNPDE